MARQIFRYIGFCGVDDSVDPNVLVLLSKQHPWVEWGILFRPDLEGTPRYATSKWVHELSRLGVQYNTYLNLAGHFCGSRCEEILQGKSEFTQSILDLGFRRIQVNATKANNVDISKYSEESILINLRNVINQFPQIEWIIQCNPETDFLRIGLSQDTPSNMSYLYDSSCGTGKVLSITSLPLIHDLIPCGYAGGIGPNTIQHIINILISHLTTTNATPSSSSSSQSDEKKTIWIDMESSLREHIVINNVTIDRFSIHNVLACISILVKHFNF